MKKELDIQKTNIEILLELIKQNPDLDIVPMVDGELGGDDWSYWMGKWGKAEVDEVYHEDERIYFKSTDEDELVEKQGDNIYDEEYPGSKQLTDEENEDITKKAENYVKNLPWEKVITVKIELP